MVEKYLTYLINALSNLKIDDKSKLKDLMPWSKSLPDVNVNKNLGQLPE